MSTWNHEEEIIIITFDQGLLLEREFERRIKALGYTATPVDSKLARKSEKQNAIKIAPFEENLPTFYKEALLRAKKSNRIVIIDFWSPWCIPCKRLKKETFHDKGVQKLLGDIEIVYVNLDEHASLGKSFRVSTMPDVFFIAPDRQVVDRLSEFESPAVFKKRLRKVLAK